MEEYKEDNPIFCRSCGVKLKHEPFPHFHEKRESSIITVSRMRICSGCDSVVLEVFTIDRRYENRQSVSEFYPDFKSAQYSDLKNLKDKIPPKIYSVLEECIESLNKNLLRGCYCYLLSIIELLCNDKLKSDDMGENIETKILKIKSEASSNLSQHHLGKVSQKVYENFSDIAITLYQDQENLCTPSFTPEREKIVRGLDAIKTYVFMEYVAKKSVETAFDYFDTLTEEITQKSNRR